MMRVNVFEGSRRLGLLLRIVWVVVALFFTNVDEPRVSITYETFAPLDEFRKASTGCNYSTDKIEPISRPIGEGRTASISLCFRAQSFGEDGKQLVPYLVKEDGTDENGKPKSSTWGNTKYSDVVESYAKRRGGEFVFSESDRLEAEAEYGRLRWQQIKTGVKASVIGWFVLLGLQVVAGWIIRGFMGIPRGRDERPTATP